MKIKKSIFIFLILLVSIFLLSSCTILDRFFGIGSSNNDNNQNGISTISVNLSFDTTSTGDVKFGLAWSDGSWEITPDHAGYYDGGGGFSFDIANVPDGDWIVKVFIDLNNNGDPDPDEPYGEYEIYVDYTNTDYYSIDITVSDSGTGSEIIKNGDFTDPNWSDNYGVYNSISERDAYLNSNDGDYLSEWTYWILDNFESLNIQPEIIYNSSDNSISFRTYNTGNATGTAMGMDQDYVDYKIESNSKFEISFRINSFGGGDFNIWFEAPVKVMFKINGVWYVARGFTTYTGNTTYGEVGLSTGQIYTFSYDLDGLQLVKDDGSESSRTLYQDDNIESVRIESNGWYWDVDIYYFKIF